MGYLSAEERKSLASPERKKLRTERRRTAQAANKIRRRERGAARREHIAELVADFKDIGLEYSEMGLRAWVSARLRDLAEEWPDEQPEDQMSDEELAAELTDLFIDNIDAILDWSKVELPTIRALGMTVGAVLEMVDGPIVRLTLGNRIERAIYAILIEA